ncbi:Transposon Ty3-G Gag-Pol polyprotein [Araneus ventricosus]|uniref:RNA-directed DNA polymerase n=1 Tax=Araneus ventricosus TaxID=182803 RepID=A0A4Y2MFW9_ARAVE|nr:Transposon Ty3-G Gag-Pol polyprotein [Araneus ventricosus]
MQCEAQCCDMQCDANKIYDMQFVDKYKSSVVQNTVINYSDIESAISKFNAESHENIANWLDHFENISQLFSLSDLQKFIFAKRSLGGTAALFVRTEPQINSWQKLKQALIDEFSFEINSAHLHELLSKRKMKDSESASEYFLKMKELCSSGKIEDAALMHYVIKGINDRQENKTILYGCKNLLEFKEKLKVYEVIKSDYAKSKAVFDKTKARYDSNPKFNSFDKLKPKQVHDDRFNSKNESANKVKSSGGFERMKYNNFESRKSKFCFNCGDPTHISRFCVHKDKGFKCFECGTFGHKASECDKTKSKPEVATLDVKFKPRLDNKVTIEDISVNSLIDTGSQATLLRKSVFDKLNICKLYPLNLSLSGFGKCKVNPLGYFKGNIKIDDFKCNADIYVVENNVMSYDVIVGMNVLMQGETVINEDGIVIKEKFQRREEVDSLSVLPIDVTPNEVELNIGPDVPNIFKDKVQQSILNYVPHKTKATNVELNILVKSNEPISHQPRRLPFSEKKIVQTQVAEWLEQGIVEPCSSEYSSPVVIVRKKDGTPRVCIDYRRLNKVVVKDRFPLPLIEDILDRLQGSRVFSTIDLKNAFFHVDVNKDSRKYTSFVTHEGQYQFLKVPFGLCNSPAVFERYINTIFRPLINDGIVLPYLDDIIILSSSIEEGIERVERVLSIASEYGLEINFNKSHFLKKRIEFLGHVVEDGKIFPSTLKTKSVLNFPEPANLKQIHSFLGLTGYFRKFIPKYSTIARPLSDLFKKDRKFKFGEEERISFNQLKLMLAEKPVLRIYNPNYETELHTDASLEGCGAILMQKSPDDKNFHPTYYISKKTTDAEKKYSSYELEALAVIEAVKKFRVYLLGIPFKIVTDCSALEKTMQKKDLVTRVARWALLLEEFDYVIEHRSGTRMTHVDALSRSPIDIFCISFDNILPRLKSAQDNDNEVKAIKELLRISAYENYCDRNGILYKFVEGKELVVVPDSMQTEIIRNAHERGHTGVKYTEKYLLDYYYIPKLRQKVEKIISNCVHCILINQKRGKKEGLLHPLQKEDTLLHTYHIDHLGPLESTNKNYKYVLAIIDAFTKFVWIYPTKSTTSAEVIAKLKIQKAVFGSPFQIISDRGTAFTSGNFADYCAKEKIKHHAITTGLPRANGQIERINQTIISVLSKLSLENPNKWYKFTNELQQTINSTYQRSIDTTPFELLFGTKMNTGGLDKLKEMVEAEFQANFEAQREELRKHAKQQIFKIQEENRKTYNLRRREPKPYRVGDLVAIKRTQFGPHLKLKPKYFGPYSIMRAKGGNTYDVIKEGNHEGPNFTTTCAEYLKPWNTMTEL